MSYRNKHTIKAVGVIMAISTVLAFLPGKAFAVPAFARQTNMACVACHFQNFPALNSFGRSFRAGGYIKTGGTGMIEGDDLSIPVVLNAAIIAKLRYVSSNGNTNEGTDEGSIQWPDEAAILVGGKLSNNAGFIMELGLKSDGVNVGLPGDENPGEGSSNTFLSTKIHFNVGQMGDAQISIIPFSTDGLGAGYGMELMNTGAQRSQRPIENRGGFSAANALGLLDAATGVTIAATKSDFFANYSLWVPGWNESNLDGIKSFSHYFRAAYMPNINNWDTGIGFQIWHGDTDIAAGADPDEVTPTDAWVIDAQAQGEFNGMATGLYASYGKCSSEAGHMSSTCQNADDAKAFGILGQVTVAPKVNLYLAYSSLDNGEATDSDFDQTTLGINYMLNQNIRFELFHVAEGGSGVNARTSDRDQTTTLQLFAGF